MGGDLNSTLGGHEIWGPRAQDNQLAGYFVQKLHECHLIDIDPIKLKPTWTNKRAREYKVANRLDHFLISQGLLMMQNMMFRQWADSREESDLYQICLEILNKPKKPASPFK